MSPTEIVKHHLRNTQSSVEIGQRCLRETRDRETLASKLEEEFEAEIYRNSSWILVLAFARSTFCCVDWNEVADFLLGFENYEKHRGNPGI